jgi:hypothetical protein
MSMGAFAKWLTNQDQKDLFEIVFAITLNLLFLVLITLLLWLLVRPSLAFALAKGYGLLWIGIFVSAWMINFAHRLFRVTLYDHSNLYVISNLAVSCLLQAGWSVFAATTVHRLSPGESIWIVVVLYSVGALSCVVTYFAVSSFFQGHIYKLVSLPLGVIIFITFSIWVAS